MDNVPDNMEGFHRVALELLAQLYDSFPRPMNIDRLEANNLGFAAAPSGATEQQSWNIGTMGSDVIEWLAEEGFLRYEPDPSRREGYFWKVRLTLKGLTILGYVPSVLQPKEPKEPLIDKVKRTLTSGAATATSETIKLVVSQIFKLALAPGGLIASHIRM